MKKSDIAMLILIASIAALAAFVIGDQLSFLKPDPKGVKVPTTTKITSDVSEPDKRVFNGEATNPTVQTVIGGSPSAN